MDQVSIDKIISGDLEAFSQVYNQYCNKVYSLALNGIKDEFEAEDIMQEIFMALPNKIGSLKNPNAFESWLYRMTRNKTIDYIRKRKNVNFSELNSEDEEYSFESSIENDNRDFQPEESFDYSETKAIMQNIINSLPAEQRECVALRCMEGFSLNEIAEKTNTPLPTVKSRLKYAKAKIEQEVKALEKKGTKLYGISGLAIFPFLRWMLSNGKSTSSAICATAMSPAGIAVAAGTSAAGNITAAIKITAITVCSAVVIGGTTVGATLISKNIKNNKPLATQSAFLENTSKPTAIIIATHPPTATPEPTPIPKPEYKVENFVFIESSGAGYLPGCDSCSGDKDWRCNYVLPVIKNIESEDIDAFNSEISQKVKNVKSATNKKTAPKVANYTYSAWVTNNTTVPILTIVITEPSACYIEGDEKIYYHFDLETGKKLKNDAIIAYSGIPQEQIQAKIEARIREYYAEKRKDESIAHIYSQYMEEMTITLEYYKNSAKYYYNENGNLCVLYKLAIEADGGEQLNIIIE